MSKKARKTETEIDVPLDDIRDFAKRGAAAQKAVDEVIAQAQLDRIETEDANIMLQQIAACNTGLDALAVAKRWLKKHWSDGWKAAGGKSGAPE